MVPFNKNQDYGFEIIKKTYSAFPYIKKVKIETEIISKHNDLRFLREKLFSFIRPLSIPKMENIKLIEYPNRDREIIGCIQQLRQWFEKDGYRPEDVIIVMRSKEYLERLHDHLAMNPLYFFEEDANGNKIRKPVELYISPRLLLLTPVGRFILTLYNIWENESLIINADQMEMILGSGWLGTKIQNTTPVFRALKYQFFHLVKQKKIG